MRERYKKRQQNVEERTWQTEIVKKEEKIYKIIDDKILPARLSSMKKTWGRIQLETWRLT